MNFQFLEKKTFILVFGGVLIGVFGIGLLQIIVMYPLGLLPILLLRPRLLIFLMLVQFSIGCGIGSFIWNRFAITDSVPTEVKPKKPRAFNYPRTMPSDKKKTIGRKIRQSVRELPRSIKEDFPLILESASPNIREVQIGCMRYIFGCLGIEYLPMLCTDIIDETRQDTISCFFEFLSRTNIDPDELLIRDSVIERVKFETTIGILLEADDIRRGFNVSPIPIYKALRISIEEAELLLDKMRDVASLLKTMSAKKKVLFEYKRWFLEVKEKLEHWEEYDSTELQKAFDVAEKFNRYQIRFDSHLEDITEILTKLKGSKNWDSIEKEVVNQYDILNYIKSLLCDPPSDEDIELEIEEGLGMLESVFMALNDLLKKIGGYTFNAGDQIREKVVKEIQLLGLKFGTPFTEVKSTYRKMALKYHPDRNKSRDAEQKMKDLNNAWEVLCKYYKNIKEEFVHV
ncbi:MAG: J domain-containing protein [bacterium]